MRWVLPLVEQDTAGENEAMARLWAKTTTFESVSIGDELPIVVKWETSDTIEAFLKFLSPHDAGGAGGGEEAGEDPLRSTEAASQALVSYATELLEKGFPLPNIVASGSSLNLKLVVPVKPEDSISMSGRVVDKVQADGLNLVKCLVVIENQDNQLVAEATATISL